MSTGCWVFTDSVTKLTREVDRLGSTAARLKLKGIDGDPHNRWSVWFNSRQNEKPHQGLTCYRTSLRKLGEIRKDDSTGAAWLSSARAVRCSLKWGNERNPRSMLNYHWKQPPLFGFDFRSNLKRGGGRRGRRQVSTALIPWATHTLQWRRTMGRKLAIASKSLKFRLSSDWSLQLDSMK